MSLLLRVLSLGATLALAVPACAGGGLPPQVSAALKASGLPLKSFGLYVRPVDSELPAALAELNAEQPFQLASTAKVVTSLAALRLLGSDHQWRSHAFATGPMVRGRLAGDLVIGGAEAGLTPADLRRWFAQMRSEGLSEVSGRIVLDHVALLQDPPSLSLASAADGGGAEPTPRGGGRLVVQVAPAAGPRASIALRPAVGVQVINDVAMGGGCSVYARWKTTLGAGTATPAVWVSGRWDKTCGSRDAATLNLPQGLPVGVAAALPPAPVSPAATVAQLWREAGLRVRGGVVEARKPTPAAAAGWSSQLFTSMADRLRDINKPSLNVGAQRLLLALAGSGTGDPLPRARSRLQGWLRDEGLKDDDVTIELGSGQSHNERGKPRAMVQLLHNAWRNGGTQSLVDSLPVAGVDGTLVNRLRRGTASGRAYLKTGTLSDTRALAGYVVGKSGRVYAVAAMVNHPQAARGTPALDAVIEWVARNG
ncbi:D-alanyl-D-alanine carboxypeptidase/D-alanyl-D-alanine-endopeptidase [Ideonella sp. BN130291]|uniref:D-alanyl-D-alanine carboxypeptidase/D-alanyl-D-alanine-endopeptidase n=1 Tax=Ideonella sp. BN130291 TaxID=3112940 RepID=UPI002E25E63E|nr:D-alanyl-D-alanine carboxypeptidase [Ideonella sp. BN130291]